MTKINRIVMRGFKSFGLKTDLIFGDKFNVILGPNGSGKCVTGDTLVFLADGSLVPIQDLIAKKEKENACQRIDDGYIYVGDATSILCLNLENYRVESRSIKAYVKRTAPEKLLTLRTRSGRKITTTPYHPLFILKDGVIVSACADELCEGQKIAVPRSLPVHPTSNIFVELLDEIHVEDGVYVPWSKRLDQAIKTRKQGHWFSLAERIHIPSLAIKGFFDRQAINFGYLVPLLRELGYSDLEMVDMVSTIKGKVGSKCYPMVWRNSPELARLLGYLLAEGKSTLNNQLWFTNGTEEIVEDYACLVQTVFSERVSVNEYKPNVWDVLVYSQPIQVLLSKFGMPKGKGTADKSISSLYLSHCTSVEIAHLLNGLYCGDGYISPNSIEITTKSKHLATCIETCLLRLGILPRTMQVVKIATNSGFSGEYYNVVVYGQENFAAFLNHISLIHHGKRERVSALLGKIANPNVDLIEANALVKDVVKMQGLSVKKLKKQYPKLDAYCYNQCTPSRQGVRQLLDEVFTSNTPNDPSFSDVSGGNQLLQLQRLAHADVFWDELLDVTEVLPQDPWVYDLCVDEHHNFIANNMYVHNSNVMDSLCFVLGKGSAKAMRAEKSANLIYNGGKEKQPAKEGEVSVYFDNAKKEFPLEDPEIKITRIIRQDGQSIYKINDQRRTRQEILELLSHAHIDPDGYNIILQGDIVRLVEMSPQERRQLVEEIAGINIYEEKKEKALHELEKVDEKLKEAEIILAERKTYLNDLRKERDQAQKYKDISDKLKRNKATYLDRQMKRKLDEKGKNDKAIGEIDEKIKTTQGTINELKQQIAEMKQTIVNVTKEIEEKGEKEQVTLMKDVEKLRIEMNSNKTRIESHENELKRITARKDQLQESLHDIEKKMKELHDEESRYGTEKDDLEKEKLILEKKIAGFREKNKLDDAEHIDKEVEECDKLSDEKQRAIQELREQQQNILREKDKIEYQLLTIDGRIKKVLEIEQQHREELDKIKQMREEFKKATKELNEAVNEDVTYAAQLGNARGKLNLSREELAKLEAKSAGIRESSAGSIAHKRILDDKNSFQGEVYGTLAELGRVDSKYSVALEIAAGPKIKSIVVDTDKTAAECIKFLKKERLGTATFLPLNKIKSTKEDSSSGSLEKTSGVHGKALNLVSFDPKFKNAFSYVFGSTVVVDNIDVARRIGIGTARMATLDGDLAEQSGAMVGGYRESKKSSSGFQEKQVVENIEKYQSEIAALEGMIGTLEERRTKNEEKIQRLRTFKATLEAEVQAKEKALHLESDDLEVSKKLKNELKESVSKYDTELTQVQMKISSMNSELAQMKIKKQQLRDKISMLRNPRLIAEINAFEQKRRETQERVILLEGSVRNIHMQRKNILEPEQENILKIMRQHEKEYEQFTNTIKELQKTIVTEQEELKVKEKKQQEYYGQFKGLFKHRDALNVNLQKLEMKAIGEEEHIRRQEQQKNIHALENARVTTEFKTFEEEYKKYEGVELYSSKSEEELKQEIWEFERTFERLGNVNLKALEIYDAVEKEYNSLLEKKDKLGREKEEVLLLMNEIETKKKELFMKTFDILSQHFAQMFASLSTKGEAYLELENPENPLSEGVNIKVRVTGKKFLDIRSLSGGEKTMTALALIFAIQEHEPASFYVFDEVDAALDKKNSQKLAELIKKYSDRAQYVIISHNDGVITEADTLYGVSMTANNMSKVISLKV